MKAHTEERMKRADVINMIKAENMNIDANKLKMNLDKRIRNQELHDIEAQINLEPKLN